MSTVTSESLPSISGLFNHPLTTSVNYEKVLNSKGAQEQAREFNTFKPTTPPYTSLESCPKYATGPGIYDQCEWERRGYPSII
jgi:hypothetical protein